MIHFEIDPSDVPSPLLGEIFEVLSRYHLGAGEKPVVMNIVAPVEAKVVEPEPEEEKPVRRGPGRPRKVETKAVEPEPEPDESSDDEDEDDDVAESALSKATATATKMVAEGKTAKVRAALGEVGIKRVSELKEGDAAKFLAALS